MTCTWGLGQAGAEPTAVVGLRVVSPAVEVENESGAVFKSERILVLEPS